MNSQSSLNSPAGEETRDRLGIILGILTALHSGLYLPSSNKGTVNCSLVSGRDSMVVDFGPNLKPTTILPKVPKDPL